MGEVLVRRDEDGRLVGFTLQGMQKDTTASASAVHLLRATVASVSSYLYIRPTFSAGKEFVLTIDRSDPHLDREIDAIMETLLIGLKMLEKEYPHDLVVREAGAKVRV